MTFRKHLREYVAALIAMVAVLAGFAVARGSATPAAPKPTAGMETATFAGGCFWSLEAAFRQVKGVTDTVVGYTGETIANPTYEGVSSHRIDHLEACRVTFDPVQISYGELVEYFLRIHTPATADHQGLYVGSPARLLIFFHDTAQQTTAKTVKEKWQTSRPIVTEIVPESRFYRAEEDQQRYLEKHGLASCKMQP